MGPSSGISKTFTRELTLDVEKDLDTKLDWLAVDHWNTDNPHVHVLIRGQTGNGKDLVISREYISRGFRDRAAERVTLEFGPCSEQEIRTALEREVELERWTSFDRFLRDIADERAGVVDLCPGGPRRRRGAGEQAPASGATSIDRQILARKSATSGGGFGPEGRDAMERRADHLIEEGLARRMGQMIVFARDLLNTLRRRELDEAVAKLARNRPYTSPVAALVARIDAAKRRHSRKVRHQLRASLPRAFDASHLRRAGCCERVGRHRRFQTHAACLSFHPSALHAHNHCCAVQFSNPCLQTGSYFCEQDLSLTHQAGAPTRERRRVIGQRSMGSIT